MNHKKTTATYACSSYENAVHEGKMLNNSVNTQICQYMAQYNIGSEDISSQILPHVNPGRIGNKIQNLQNVGIAG